MNSAPGAPSPITTLPNLRDIGGYTGLDGAAVRTGILFRSTDFSGMASADLPALEKLGLRTIYDLRSQTERVALPDPALPDVVDIHLDVLADAGTAIPANLGAFLSDPKTVAMATKELSGGRARELISSTYRELVSLPSALTAYRRFYQGLLDDQTAPALFHCTTGKDRTGWAAASFLTLMGVSADDVFADYLLTNERLIPALAPIFEQFAGAGGDPELLRPILGVDADYLKSAMTEVNTRYGGIEGYFEEGLGIGDDDRRRLRQLYLS